ncbi:hypothetical protein QJS66_16945 [Kocuria rhizophila]|nr:hypothetical protein QJS66_16945 [Kocuria rhizophila]
MNMSRYGTIRRRARRRRRGGLFRCHARPRWPCASAWAPGSGSGRWPSGTGWTCSRCCSRKPRRAPS